MGSKQLYNLGQMAKRFIVTNRWWLMAILSIVDTLNEVYDHFILSYPVFQVYEFFRGFIMYGVIVPIVGGILFGLLEKSETERMTAMATLNQEETFSQQIAQSTGWKDLVARISEFPSHLLPVAVSALYVVNRNVETLEYASGWRSDGTVPENFPDHIQLSSCLGCQIRQEHPNHVTPCSCDLSAYNGSCPSGFCVPLTHSDQLVGVIFIGFPTQMTIPLHQMKVFTRMAPEISLALDRALMHRSMLNQAATSESERRKIAQDLHDSLAQNIGYLRLKLDQLTGEDAISEIEEIRKDLSHMKEIADQSYEQVRETLSHLRPKDPADLEASLNNFAHSIGDRSGLTVQFESTGQHLPVSLGTYRQITFICQEALLNIEKHARASHIDMALYWSEDSLTVTIEDDGLGFDLQAEVPSGHYGITIMKERAEEIHSRLEVISSPGKGTAIHLWVPLRTEFNQPTAGTLIDSRFQRTSVN